MKIKKKFPKLMSALLAVVMMISALPMSAFAAAASDLPANMTDHSILRALEYTGYDVQQQIKDGTLYQSGSYGSRTPSSVLSNISYGTSTSGKETVADSSTPTGKAPDIARYEQYGLCCASFVTYYVCNYLPNIEGADTQFITDAINATGWNSQAVVTWQKALNGLVDDGKIEKIGTSASNVNRSKLTPGDLIIFGDSENSHKHIAVYSGTYNGVDFIIHVGNDRGPEISRVDWMGQAGDKSSYPNAYYHLPQEIFESDGEIEVYKKDTDGKNLSGAVFVATNTESGKSYKIGPTNSSGYAKTENPVPYGTYTVKETVFPTNYHAYGKTEWTVTVDANNDGLVTINAVNEVDNGSAKIVKTSEDGIVEGVTFRLKGNGVDKTVTTDENGEVQIDDLKPGTYTVTETVFDKYEPQETRNVVVVSNQVATVTFNNVLKRGDLEVIKTSEDNLVEGVQFHLYGTSLSGLAVDEYAVTDKNGVATFKDVLISGHESYTLEEVDTAERYIVPDSQRTAIEWNIVTEKSFYNELKRGDLQVKKTSEDGFVQGMKFHLYGTSFSGIKVDEYATTDSNGIAYFNDILMGTGYTIEEVNTPIRYVIPDRQTADIAWDELTEVEFENILKKWRADVYKLDAELAGRSDDDEGGLVPVDLMPMALSITPEETVEELGYPYGYTQGDATLGGAVYGVYKGEVLLDTYTTDENGYFLTKYYPCGDDYTIREITPSEGYLLDPTVYYMEASAEFYSIELNTIYPDVYEEIIMGDIAIIKHTDDGSTKIETPEVGAKFEIFLKAAGSYKNAEETERDIIVCDEHGFGQTKMLPYGVYTVHQVSGWEGRELMPDFEVYIAQDETTYRYLINNANFESYVRVVKVDAETDKTIPYAGAAFKIFNPDGELVKMSFTYPTPTTIDTFYTDANGSLVTPEKLPYGKSFTAKGEITDIMLADPTADVIIIDPEREYSPLVNALGGEIINISATSPNHINAMDMNKDYGDGANPVILKSEFIMSLCEQLIGGTNLGAKQKSIIDRCTASVYRAYQQNDYTGTVPTLQDFRAELMKQDEPEAREIALAIELFTHGSLNTFAKQTNVDTNNRLICYDILDLGKQLMPIGMLVVLDSILNRITQNRAKGKNTYIFIDEIYLLFQHEYSANFLFTLWKRVRKYGAFATGITQNVDDLLQSHTARTMLANSEFIIMLNQASTDRLKLAELLNISDLQMSYITNVEAGHGLIKVGSSLVPFANKFPKNTKLYKLMTTKPGESA